ncbi:MAG: hypothetical protein ABIR18_05045 [Chitinophagaceae bacterium]
MRKSLFSLLLILLATACKKPSNSNSSQPIGLFEIEIKATNNVDCKLPEIAFLTRQQEAYSILGDKRGTYIGLGLPKVLYPVGTKLTVRMRKPNASEALACTAMGISWTHAMITEVQ